MKYRPSARGFAVGAIMLGDRRCRPGVQCAQRGEAPGEGGAESDRPIANARTGQRSRIRVGASESRPGTDSRERLLDDALRLGEADEVTQREFAELIIAAAFTDELDPEVTHPRFTARYERTRPHPLPGRVPPTRYRTRGLG